MDVRGHRLLCTPLLPSMCLLLSICVFSLSSLPKCDARCPNVKRCLLKHNNQRSQTNTFFPIFSLHTSRQGENGSEHHRLDSVHRPAGPRSQQGRARRTGPGEHATGRSCSNHPTCRCHSDDTSSHQTGNDSKSGDASTDTLDAR